MPPDNNINRPKTSPILACAASERLLNQLASAEAMKESKDDKNDGEMAKRLGLHYNFRRCLLSYTTTCGVGTGDGLIARSFR